MHQTESRCEAFVTVIDIRIFCIGKRAHQDDHRAFVNAKRGGDQTRPIDIEVAWPWTTNEMPDGTQKE